MKIALTDVFVDIPTKAFKFYTEILGFVKNLYIPEANLAIVVSPKKPDGTGLLLEPNDNPVAHTYQEALYLIRNQQKRNGESRVYFRTLVVTLYS